MENNFKKGKVAGSKINPNQNLSAGRYVDRIYFRKIHNNPDLKDRMYYQPELLSYDLQNIVM